MWGWWCWSMEGKQPVHTNPSTHYARSARSEMEPRCYPKGCYAHGSMPCQCITRGAGQALVPSPNKNHVTGESPAGNIPVVTLIRTDTTLDHSQKAERVCLSSAQKRHFPTDSHTSYIYHVWCISLYFHMCS